MLFRYLLKTHSFFAILMLLFGLVIFFIAEIFEKLDRFFLEGSNPLNVLEYFLYSTPGMVSLILPAVCFMAFVILLCNMAKSKEITAIQAGGTSPYTLLKYLLIISFFWCGAQLFVSQVISSESNKKAQEIWDFKVNKRPEIDIFIPDFWFVDNDWVVHLDFIFESGKAVNLSAYQLSEEGKDIKQIVTGENVQIKDNVWTVLNASVNNPSNFSTETFNEYVLPIQRDYLLFFISNIDTNIKNLPLYHLNTAIDELISSGSNVESLKTAYHMKYAYAGSIFVLTLLAFALVTWKENVYICLSVGVVVVFLFYVSTMIGETLGTNGSLNPFIAAWAPHFILSFLSFLRIYKVNNN